VLRPGEHLDVSFVVPADVEPVRYEVEATGYYVPLHPPVGIGRPGFESGA
jgi:hypothetical protein